MQLVYTNNHASLHLWWKENLANSQNIMTTIVVLKLTFLPLLLIGEIGEVLANNNGMLK